MKQAMLPPDAPSDPAEREAWEVTMLQRLRRYLLRELRKNQRELWTMVSQAETVFGPQPPHRTLLFLFSPSF